MERLLCDLQILASRFMESAFFGEDFSLSLISSGSKSSFNFAYLALGEHYSDELNSLFNSSIIEPIWSAILRLWQ